MMKTLTTTDERERWADDKRAEGLKKVMLRELGWQRKRREEIGLRQLGWLRSNMRLTETHARVRIDMKRHGIGMESATNRHRLDALSSSRLLS